MKQERGAAPEGPVCTPKAQRGRNECPAGDRELLALWLPHRLSLWVSLPARTWPHFPMGKPTQLWLRAQGPGR